MKPARKISAAQLLLLSEIADFSPVKRYRANGYTSRRGNFFSVTTALGCEARGLVEVLRENPARIILTDEGRKAIGISSRSEAHA